MKAAEYLSYSRRMFGYFLRDGIRALHSSAETTCASSKAGPSTYSRCSGYWRRRKETSTLPSCPGLLLVAEGWNRCERHIKAGMQCNGKFQIPGDACNGTGRSWRCD